MSMTLDSGLAKTGTKFRLFSQPRFLKGFGEPETVYVSVNPSQMQAGPADDRMYVVDAINKLPYSSSLPPYNGQKNPPVKPAPDGHFDKLDINSREFSCAHMYATVRRVLDIWEDYFNRRIEWYFRLDYPRLELIPLIEWDNAQSGYGFLEYGYGRRDDGGIDRDRPYCENFDVLAHELGHSIIFSEIGDDPKNADFGGFHESAGDLTSIISCLHFNKVVDHLLESTMGNLFTVNELDRVGELSESREIRVAFNSLRMSDVDKEPHDRSQPLTGAIFDIFVEVFQKKLVSNKLISQTLATESTHGPTGISNPKKIQSQFEKAYRGKEADFKTALLTARDYLGRLLANTWAGFPADNLTYAKVGLRLLDADYKLSNGEHQNTIRECFAWREITLANHPTLAKPRRLFKLRKAE